MTASHPVLFSVLILMKVRRLHDLRLVSPFEAPQQQSLVHRRHRQWGISLFEYLFQVPANRVGFTAMSLAQLKIMQEVITLAVFVPFAIFYMHQPIKLDFLYAGLCLLGAVYFIFRN